jgi:2-oxoisovalerate dehydrogenase E2 component (dihydrolipoyl transacylase)
MATKDFLLPDLGEGLTEGEIVSWLVAVGDTVEVDQPVAEVETAKAVVEVPSPFAGVVTALHGEPGEEVEVGKPLVSIDTDGGAAPLAEAAPEQGASEPAGVPGRAAQDARAGEAIPSAADQVESASTLGRDEDLDDDGSGNVLVGYGTAGGARSRRRRAGGPPAGGPGPQAGAPPAGPKREGRPLAKPPVRKLAKDLGVDLAQVSGSGPDGIINREDVRAFAEGAAAAPQPAGDDDGTGTARAARTDEPGVSVTTPDHIPLRSAPPNEMIERRPVRGIRKAVARQMTVSRSEIPEATTWVDADATALWELRQELNAAQDRVKVSPLALIMRACVAGLREFPEVNATLDRDADEIVIQHFVNLGFAAQTDAGLMVPVIQRADQRSVLGIAEELNRLAAAARERKVKPEELTGGTFTLSNYGSFGVDGGAAVINHPEAAILGVGRISDRPWVHRGKVKARKVLQLSIAFDHRICDGGEAAGFLRFVADCVESPTTMLANL